MWVLVLMIHAGWSSHNDDVALTTVQGFTTEASCRASGDKVKAIDKGTVQAFEFTCIQVK